MEYFDRRIYQLGQGDYAMCRFALDGWDQASNLGAVCPAASRAALRQASASWFSQWTVTRQPRRRVADSTAK